MIRKLLLGTTLIAVCNFSGCLDYQSHKRHTLDTYIQAIIKIESNGDPNAYRFEPKINDASYGLMQILTSTAKTLEEKHPELPRLGFTEEEIANSLKNPEINIAYGTALLREELAFYKDIDLAVAAYNAGHYAPRNARIQQQLNDILKTNLVTDGVIGPKSREIIRKFQEVYNSTNQNKITVDGVLGPETHQKLQEVWEQTYPDKSNPLGIIPQNKTTPNHINKFRKALEN